MIYLLEDDGSIRKLVIYALESQGFEAMGFDTPAAFRKAMAEQTPELLLLDIMLPGEDGISILKQLKSDAKTAGMPVIMLTAKNAEYDRVEGLDAGADDYISKPFGIMELVARVRAVLRRTEKRSAAAEYREGALYVCPEKHEVRVNGEEVALTYKEFLLLCLFVENRGMVLRREVLLDRVWGLGAERENRTLDVHIRTLRSKLGSAGNYIQTVRNVGYRFVGEEA
jgi:two-component system alkaline phosphatase synthesis response regulator PhoP